MRKWILIHELIFFSFKGLEGIMYDDEEFDQDREEQDNSPSENDYSYHI